METKKRAFREIIHHVTEFALTRNYGDGKLYPGSVGFSYDPVGKSAQVGDLVALQSAGTSEWYLSWLVEYAPNNGNPKFLLESIETGKLCWWSNVGIMYFDRKTLADFSHWRWTDRQFAFKDRWWRVCFKEKDAYIHLPLFPKFGPDNSVTLGTRPRWGLGDHHPSRVFPDWRKVTKKAMGEFYDECVASEKAGAA